MQQDIGAFKNRLHLVRVGDEIRRQVAAVELHTFDNLEFVAERLGFLNRNDAFIADLFHGLRDQCADFGFAVGRNRADLLDLVIGLDVLAALGEVFDHRRNGCVDPALEVHRVAPCRYGLDAFANDSLRQNRCRRCAVAGLIVGFGGYFADELRADILTRVLQLDLLGNRHAVLGRARRAERFLNDDVTAFRTQRHLHGVGDDIHALQKILAGFFMKSYFFSSHCFSP